MAIRRREIDRCFSRGKPDGFPATAEPPCKQTQETQEKESHMKNTNPFLKPAALAGLLLAGSTAVLVAQYSTPQPDRSIPQSDRKHETMSQTSSMSSQPQKINKASSL